MKRNLIHCRKPSPHFRRQHGKKHLQFVQRREQHLSYRPRVVASLDETVARRAELGEHFVDPFFVPRQFSYVTNVLRLNLLEIIGSQDVIRPNDTPESRTEEGPKIAEMQPEDSSAIFSWLPSGLVSGEDWQPSDIRAENEHPNLIVDVLCRFAKVIIKLNIARVYESHSVFLLDRVLSENWICLDPGPVRHFSIPITSWRC